MSARAAVAAGLAVVAAAAVAAALVLLLTRSSTETLRVGTAPNAFRLSYPGSWQVVPARDGAVAALERKDGGARLTIERDLPLRHLQGLLLTQVRADFSERLEDYRLLSAGVQKASSGPVFVYAYLQPGSRAVHTVELVPAGSHSFTLTGITTGTADLEREVAAIERSFRPV